MKEAKNTKGPLDTSGYLRNGLLEVHVLIARFSYQFNTRFGCRHWAVWFGLERLRNIVNPNTFLGSFTEVGTSRIQNLKKKAKQGLGGQIRGFGVKRGLGFRA